jgi:hypothetical protein
LPLTTPKGDGMQIIKEFIKGGDLKKYLSEQHQREMECNLGGIKKVLAKAKKSSGIP